VKVTANTKDLSDFFYNLELVAPGKVEAKKTVSKGFVYLEYHGRTLIGVATDDFISIYGVVEIDEIDDFGCLLSTTDDLKRLRGTLDKGSEFSTLDLPETEVDEHLLDFFSVYHIDMICLPAFELRRWGAWVSPDRLRKFSLLEPRGRYPLKLAHTEYADRDIFRWQYGPNYRGVYAHLNFGEGYEAS
jgi:hypothetical protein